MVFTSVKLFSQLSVGEYMSTRTTIKALFGYGFRNILQKCLCWKNKQKSTNILAGVQPCTLKHYSLFIAPPK